MLALSAAAGLAFQAGGIVSRPAVTPPRSTAPIAAMDLDATTLEYIGGALVVAGGGFVAFKQQGKEGSVATKANVIKAKGVVAPARSNKNWPMVGGSGGPHRMA